jgi:SAM-dependent methyltransferase
MTGARLSPEVESLLRCPACRGTLSRSPGETLECAGCGRRYPIVGGIPVLVDETRSVFSIGGFVTREPTYFRPRGRLFRMLRSLVPIVSLLPNTRRNFRRLRDALLEARPTPRVLVIGGSIRGIGFEELLAPGMEIVETDAAHGPYTALICDAHDLPFADGSFDAVVAQCVLEHVLDPQRCVDEVHRVLRADGLAYAETAFMQQVHGGAYDFCRFSELGHRWLFRRFEPIDSGAVSGPGTALAWSYEYLLLSCAGRGVMRDVLKAFARISGFFLKYLDLPLAGRPGALDAASSVYFLGRRSTAELSPRELLSLYRGNG